MIRHCVFTNLRSVLDLRFIFPIFAKKYVMAENSWSEKGCECMEKEDYAQAKAYFEKAMEEGNAEAYCFFGDLLKHQ